MEGKKEDVNPIIRPIPWWSQNPEKLKDVEVREQHLQEAIQEARQASLGKVDKFCLKHPILCDVGNTLGVLTLKAGLIYGAYKGGTLTTLRKKAWKGNQLKAG